jgi:UDP-N-acetylmuramate--alanine ligase
MHNLKGRPLVHFIGVGGIGMSALARWFLAKNWAVSGSDMTRSPITQELKKEGVKVKIGHKRSNLPAVISQSRQVSPPIMVIYSSAVRFSNPELEEAVRQGVKPLTYAEALGCLTKVYKTVAVAGSHGKSTTSSLLGLALVQAGLDPNIVVGTMLKELRNSNFRHGRSKWLVLEADEWRGAFWNYHPEVIVSTNIDKEHLDFYKNLANVKKSFLKFFENIRAGGTLVLNRDDKNLFSLHSPIQKIARKNKAKVMWYSVRRNQLVPKIKRVIKIPGAHNVANAVAAFTAAQALGAKPEDFLKVLSRYRGAWRRFEYRGKLKVGSWKCDVYDDYAHHPTEIKATLAAFREKFPRRPIVCVYQPHQAKRLQALFKEFQTAFDAADITLVLPVYEVAGRDKVSSRYTSEMLAQAIQKKHPKRLVFYLKNPRKLKKALSTLLPSLRSKSYSPSPVLVMMGAGDIVNYTDLLI